MRFPDGLVPTNERVHPTPIYEFIVACWIAWWLWRLGSRQLVASSGAGLMPRARKHRVAAKGRATKAGPLPRGCVFAAYLVLTGAARFLVEFIRINPRSFLGMSNAQAASAISVIVGAALCWRLRKGPGAGES
jgi:phosphatidylglycerol:prolipoprotein diacylglycerol transferase